MMQCPLCKVQMEEQYVEEEDLPKWFICFNSNCSFYGMLRINKEWNDEHKEK